MLGPLHSVTKLAFLCILEETNRSVEGGCDCERSVDTLCGLGVRRGRGFQRPIVSICGGVHPFRGEGVVSWAKC